MRLFKGFFIVLAGLFIFITILSLFIPSKLVVSRAVVINAAADKVFAQVKDLRQWKNWQPVFMQDSANMKFDKDASGVSNSCTWESKGKQNKMQVTGNTGHVLTAILSREGENDVLNTISILPLADRNQVQAEWTVLIKLKWYPWEKFYGIFIEKVSGQGYEDALNSLKTYTEKN